MDTAWIYYVWALLLVITCGVAWMLSLVSLPGNWIIVAQPHFTRGLFRRMFSRV